MGEKELKRWVDQVLEEIDIEQSWEKAWRKYNSSTEVCERKKARERDEAKLADPEVKALREELLKKLGVIL